MADISIILTILIFGVVVIVHELGHFFAARRAGIFVEEFAIGMGPKLWSTKGGENKTVYSIRLLPIGGFCKMLGEDENQPDDPRALNNKKVLPRMLVMAAGAIMNFLLAFIIYLVLLMLNGYSVASVRSVIPDSPAEQAGLAAGDKLTHINGHRIGLYEDFSFELTLNGANPVKLDVNRAGQKLALTVQPKQDEYGAYKIGFYPDVRFGLLHETPEGYERAGFFDSAGTSFNRIIFVVKTTVVGITRLVTGQGGMIEMTGPIGIASIVSDEYEAASSQGIINVVLTMALLCALISANLGVMNLLPLPALDGGRLVFLLYEAIRRKPVPPEREGTVHFVGFVLLMILAVFIAYQDIIKLL